jgi:ubiquinone/menaquinone biosynthesis C-methylase UbiE
MQLHEYQRNYELEQHYWWFVGVRAMVRSLLSLSPGQDCLGRVLDIGCGTGALLDQLQARSAELWGLDISHEALKYCALRGHKHLILADAANVPFPSASFDVITAIGVIEHLEDDYAFLLEIKRLLKPDGSFIMLTSSFPFLWSMHDTANEHKRRYYLRQLNQQINQLGFVTIRFSHLNFLLFPIIAPMLLFHRFIYGIQSDHPERILPTTPQVINNLLTWFLRVEAKLMGWTALPWSISMIGVFKRRGCES